MNIEIDKLKQELAFYEEKYKDIDLSYNSEFIQDFIRITSLQSQIEYLTEDQRIKSIMTDIELLNVDICPKCKERHDIRNLGNYFKCVNCDSFFDKNGNEVEECWSCGGSGGYEYESNWYYCEVCKRTGILEKEQENK